LLLYYVKTSEGAMSEEVEDDKPGWPILTLWAKYEDIAMHFNDLILKLRTAALGGVAVLATLVSIFGKSDPGHFGITWEIAFLVFIALILFWLAIWVLDFAYYNLAKSAETNSEVPYSLKILEPRR
jgi:hypothetical protein